MGSELRKFSKNATPDGEKVRSIIESGNKVGPEYIIELSKQFIEKNKEKKIIIDGAIRDIHQNEAMESVWGDFDVIYLDLDEELAVTRLVGRRIDPVTQETFPESFTGEVNPKTGNILVTRSDDTEEAIRKRITWSISDTLPLIGIWQEHGHQVFAIDADQDEEDIFTEIEKVLEK